MKLCSEIFLEKLAEVSFNPFNWKLGLKVPGGDALQNPAVAGIGGGLLGALAQQAFSKESPNINTLIAALIPAGILGGMSYSANKALSPSTEEPVKGSDNNSREETIVV